MMKEKYKLLKKKNVLYIEDDLILQKNILEVLSSFFNTLLVASDGDEAYDIYLENQSKIDIIITDINMPNTDGITFCRYIRRENQTIPIVVISAYTDTDYLLDSIDLNIMSYITKPFTTKKTFLLLDKFLNYFKLNSYIFINADIQIDYESFMITVKNEKIQLTQKEAIFLKLLSENSVVPYDMMYSYIWDYAKSPSQDTVKSFVKKLKKKIPLNLFKNKKGVGYYLEVDSS